LRRAQRKRAWHSFCALNESRRLWVLALICLAAIAAALFVQPIPQDPANHRFVDSRTLAGIPN
jgi:hypothetical protein